MHAYLVASVMSDSVQPHGQQPTMLLCSQDSLGKNTGVDYHFLLPLADRGEPIYGTSGGKEMDNYNLIWKTSVQKSPILI